MGYPPRQPVKCKPCNGTGLVGAGRSQTTCKNCNGMGTVG